MAVVLPLNYTRIFEGLLNPISKDKNIEQYITIFFERQGFIMDICRKMRGFVVIPVIIENILTIL
ncbi:hypothetical protein ABE096_12290 [Robertmurraya massiliosenegalensis]|uniref:hypothetical protein n=1 Tax=Robertmurraya massiliosenegalensis TaxID=1287657 RepID=UPI003D2D827A